LVDRPVKALNDALRNVSRSLHKVRLGNTSGRIGEGSPSW
jgi:hypothetical protein